jgi:hypothetical protein
VECGGSPPLSERVLKFAASPTMDAFSYLAEQSIRTSSDGVRFLALCGPFARAYAIASPDTEERIVRRLAGLYRLLPILVLALGALLCRWPRERVFVTGPLAIAMAGWLIVRMVLHRDIRRLKRFDPRARAKSADFVRQLEPIELRILVRRRRSLISLFLVMFIYATGFLIAFHAWTFSIVGAALYGFVSFRCARLALCPPEAMLAMRPCYFDVLDPDGPTSESHERARPRSAKFTPASAKSGVWDSELDGG